MKQWGEAASLYGTMRLIYDKLSTFIEDSELIELYHARYREVENVIKLCEYNSREEGSEPTEEMRRLTLEPAELELDFDVSLLIVGGFLSTICLEKSFQALYVWK